MVDASLIQFVIDQLNEKAESAHFRVPADKREYVKQGYQWALEDLQKEVQRYLANYGR